MLTDAQRLAYERRLQQAFAGAMGSRQRELLRLLGTPPDISHVPASFWAGLDTSVAAAVGPLIVEMAKTSALGLGASAGIAGKVNWGLVNMRAADWASRYTYNLVRGIDATTRDALQAEISRFFLDPKTDLKTLAGQLQPDVPALVTRLGQMVTSQARSEMVAITEVTRAASEGEQALVDQIKQDNPRVKVIGSWLTSNDELVCMQICVPLHGVHDDGHGNFVNPKDGRVYRMPGHPRCRCARGTVISGL